MDILIFFVPHGLVIRVLSLWCNQLQVSPFLWCLGNFIARFLSVRLYDLRTMAGSMLKQFVVALCWLIIMVETRICGCWLVGFFCYLVAIHFPHDHLGRPSGDCFLELTTQQDERWGWSEHQHHQRSVGRFWSAWSGIGLVWSAWSKRVAWFGRVTR